MAMSVGYTRGQIDIPENGKSAIVFDDCAGVKDAHGSFIGTYDAAEIDAIIDAWQRVRAFL